ncbi:unnamed protein product, partial [Onchocerca flexuosa]|uniref:Ras-GEF domain-containing protein n=1 Tax=Onchocerca flexuosa TaxID=387005 RepID=A0A183I8L9_9BILA
MLSCAASELSTQCTEQALMHVVRMLRIWVRKFDPNCSISGFGSIKDTKTEDDFSLDSSPTHISIDQAISSLSSTTIQPFTASLFSNPESDASSSASDSFSEITTTKTIPLPEFEFQTMSQPESTSTSDIELGRRTDISSTIPEPNPENESTDSTPSVQSSPDSSPEPEPDAAVNDKKWKMK